MKATMIQIIDPMSVFLILRCLSSIDFFRASFYITRSGNLSFAFSSVVLDNVRQKPAWMRYIERKERYHNHSAIEDI